MIFLVARGPSTGLRANSSKQNNNAVWICCSWHVFAISYNGPPDLAAVFWLFETLSLFVNLSVALLLEVSYPVWKFVGPYGALHLIEGLEFGVRGLASFLKYPTHRSFLRRILKYVAA